jgi:hypothetical protein
MKCLLTPTFVASPGGPCFDQSIISAGSASGYRPFLIVFSLKIYLPFYHSFFFFLLLASLAENIFLSGTRHVKKVG